MSGRRATHRYAKSGAVTLRVSATDKAGNAVASSAGLHIRK